MLTSLATPLAVGLLAVTFGWNPAEPPAGKAAADSYEYQLRLSEADIEALRAGRLDSLTSELPRELRQIDRVRITLGSDTPPRVLTERDRQSPRRIAAASTAQKYTVAKPVSTPEWNDAAALAARDGTPTAQRWTVYQGQGAFGPGGLAEGFREGVSRTGEFVEGQARNFAEGTRGVLQRGSQAVQNGTRGLLDGAERTLERALPPRADGVFGQRPAAGQFGQQPAPFDNRVAPPAPTATPAQSFQPPPQDRAPMPLREPAQQGFQDNRPLPDNRGMPAADPRAVQGPQFTSPMPSDGGMPRNEGLAESFAERDRMPDRRLTPIAREPVRQPTSDYDPFANSRDFDQRDPRGFDDRRERFTQTQAQFPERRSGMPPEGFAPIERQPPQALPFNRTQQQPLQFTSADQQNAARPVGDAAAGLWNENSTRPTGEGPSNETPTETPTREADWVQTLMMIALTAVTCFTLIAYFDLRNRYRMALRGLPNSGYNPAI